MAKKTKKSVEKVPEIDQKESQEEDLLSTKRALCHPGEASYHLITQLQILNQQFLGLTKQIKRIGDLLEEDSEEDSEAEEEEDSDDESEEEESEEE